MNTMVFSPVLTDQVILQDLINSLLVEEYISEQSIFSKTFILELFENNKNKQIDHWLEHFSLYDDFVLLSNIVKNKFIIFPVEKAIRQNWKISQNTMPYLIRADANKAFQIQRLFAPELFNIMHEFGIFQHCDIDKINTFKADLNVTIEQSRFSEAHQIDPAKWLVSTSAELFFQFEQYAALRDRPYHPFAKLKDGFAEDEYQNFSPEFAQELDLNWIAIHKDKMVYGDAVTDLRIHQPAKIFLSAGQYLQLREEFVSKSIGDEYIALPIHPWQFEHILDDLFHQELRERVIIPLAFTSNEMYASSSLRSLLYQPKPHDSLKLPLAVKSLSSLRYLPIVKMINGQKNLELLKTAKQKDPVLAQRLWLCDENQWWGYLPDQIDNLTPDNLTLFKENPMQLAAQRRRIPLELLQSPYQIIPMASLGQLIDGQACVFDLILKWQVKDSTKNNVIEVFSELCRDFFDVNLRLFQLGLMGEIHGQNICIVLKHGQFSGFMLRDHDSVRIHLPWMDKHGLQDPVYLSPHDFRITLYHDTIPELILYLQTLGIQVNLASILEAVAEYYQIAELELWQVIKQQLQLVLNEISFEDEDRKLLQKILFEQENWPYKQLIRPLLEQNNRKGSMPSSVGSLKNIFKQIDFLQEG